MAQTMNLSQMQTNQTGGLGAQLDEMDVLLSRIGARNSQQAFQILNRMDAIDCQIKEMQEHGANIKAEEGQYETACAILRKQAAAFVRDAGGASALRSEREKRNPPEGAWWWRLDEIAAQKSKESTLRFVKWGAALVILVGVLVAAYQIFLAPSPEVMARYEAIDKTTTLAESGNYTEALAAIQKGLDAAPDDPELLLWQGVIYSMQGNDQQAAAIFSKVQGQVSGAEAFYLMRAQDYLTIGQNPRAEQDAQAAINANPKSARGYYILGSAQENAGDSQSALKSYQMAVDLADQANDSELIVEAKVKMGYLMQGAGAGSTGVSTPTSGVKTP
jgi:tetratricopeptide (TPR) repeat protein